MNTVSVNIHIQVFVWTCIFSSLVYIAGSYDSSMFKVLRNWYCFPKWLYHLRFPSAMYEGCNILTSLLTLIIYLFSNSHPSWFVNGLFVFLFLICKFLYIVDTRPFSDIWVCEYFLPLGGFFLDRTKNFNTEVFNFDKVQWSISLVACAFGVLSKKLLPNPRSRRFHTCVFF